MEILWAKTVTGENGIWVVVDTHSMHKYEYRQSYRFCTNFIESVFAHKHVILCQKTSWDDVFMGKDRKHLPITSTWPHLRCDVGLEEGEYWKKNSLCYSIMYYYNGAQRYEQFLQVGWLFRALILLG